MLQFFFNQNQHFCTKMKRGKSPELRFTKLKTQQSTFWWNVCNKNSLWIAAQKVKSISKMRRNLEQLFFPWALLKRLIAFPLACSSKNILDPINVYGPASDQGQNWCCISYRNILCSICRMLWTNWIDFFYCSSAIKKENGWPIKHQK